VLDGLALGGLWEIFECFVGVSQTYDGFTTDLIMDACGGGVAGGVAAWAVNTQPREELTD
jgi:hypothetical protein